jgi:DNA-binding winged helix-turn-helix (wHTH) protein
MTGGSFSFLGYCLDPGDRQLKQNDIPVELNARYFDALALLVREAGQLVTKDRFLDEVWRGVPVTDEALTQCIKTLRRQLGDQANTPRFIETVPKHGYRFIAPVSVGERDAGIIPQATHSGGAEEPASAARQFARLGLAGTMGGGAAGLVGGLLYGFATASGPVASGVGEASALLVLIFLTLLAGLIGGAGVSLGIAASFFAKDRALLWTVTGGAFGGLAVGAFARLLGLDAFNLLLGQSPGDITGGAEGALLGAAVGLGAWLALRMGHLAPIERAIAPAAIVGGAAGLLIPLMGGQMMGGSLDLLARQFPASHLRLGQIGALFGEVGFGPVSQMVTGAIEGSLFAIGIVGAMTLARRLRAGA